MAVQLNPQILSHHVQMQADARPDHRVFTFESPVADDRSVNYGDMWLYSNRLASYFEQRGFAAGDKVAILMRNHPEFVYALVASSIRGVQLVPIDPRTRGAKLSYQLKNSEARMVICTSDLADQLTAEVLAPTAVQSTVLFTPPGQIAASLEGADDLMQILQTEQPTLDQGVDNPRQPHQIIYTSGTTGDPKGVVLTVDRAAAAAGLAAGIFGYKPQYVLYTGLSLTHGNAQMVTCFPAIFAGYHAVLSERFTRTRIWDICRKYGVNTWSNLGGILSGVYNMPPREDDADNPVEFVVSAGTPRAIWESFMERFNVDILEWYAAVEGGLCWKPRGQGPIGTFGRPIPGMLDIKLVREDGDECDVDEIGELISRPASGAKAEVDYYKNKDASDAKTAGGWLRSGDMVHRDSDGWLFFDFRKGGGIRHNGDFVSTDYVERAVGEHEGVGEVFVYGVPASSGAPGESDVVAAVVPFGDGDLDVGSVFDKCRADLEPNIVPSYLHVVDEIPKTISEKPMARILQEAFSVDAANVYRVEDHTR